MLSEGGIIGLAVLLAVLLAVGCRYMRVVKNHGSERLSSLWLVFGAALAGMLIHGLFENTVTQIQTGWLIGALLGLIWKRYQTVG
jgi:O-antigen ligase